MATFNLNVNGKSYTVDADPDSPLLYTLIDDIQLRGPKFGCGESACGSCTVLVDGRPTRSCVFPISFVAGQPIVSIEGLGTPEKPHPIQQAFIDEQALQCGYCISGIMLTGLKIIQDYPNATPDEIYSNMGELMCRCHVHTRMMRALLRYQKSVQG